MDKLNLFDGFNINPVPLEFSNSMTTTKLLGAIQEKVNKIVELYNKQETESEKFTKQEIEKVMLIIDKILNGDYIKDNSITYEKLSKELIDKIIEITIDLNKDCTKFVVFGIDDNGYFYCDVPDKWDNISFDTTVKGELILEY